MRFKIGALATCLLAAFIAGAIFSARDEGRGRLAVGSSADAPTFTLYTTPGATAPQIPFWAGVKSGDIPKLFNLHVELWKDLDDLQGVLLAGKGDIWLGHVEGFARAAIRGAPVRLLAVTGWRKFYLLSTNESIRSPQDLAGRTVSVTPPGSPAVPILQALLGPDQDSVFLEPHEAKQLSLLLLRGGGDPALAPEPLATVLLDKVPGLRVVFNVEEMYGGKMGRQPRLPIAGIAVNARTAREHPERVKALLRILVEQSRIMGGNPDRAADVLPTSFASFMPREIVRQSLARDWILAEPAADVEAELNDYLRVADPELLRDGPLPESWIWRGVE